MSRSRLNRSYTEITTVASDLDYYCDTWKSNENATQAQRDEYGYSKIAHTQLGKDDPKSLCLLAGDGFDGETLGSVGRLATRKFFYFEDHLFPPDRDLLRFGMFFHLGFFRTLHLVIKNQWEIHLFQQKKGVDYIAAVKEHDDDELLRHLNSFKLGLNKRLDCEAIFDLFEEHGQMASVLGYDQQRFAILVEQMIKSRVLYCANNGPELQTFIINQQEELALLKETSCEQEQEFWLKKCCWMAIQNELGGKLLLREEVRLKNFNINIRWLSIFGALFQDLLERQMYVLQLERRLEIKRMDPKLTETEIDKLVDESMKKDQAELEKLKEQAMMSALLCIMGPNGSKASGDEVKEYEKEVRKILNEIWRRTHPDGMQLKKEFTERQRQRLREFFEEAMKIKHSEALLDVRSLPVLQDILEQVMAIYASAGIELEPDTIIRGTTMEEQMAWLEKEIQRREREIGDLRAEITAMAMNQDIREKQASMATEESRKETMESLEQNKKKCEERLLALEAEYCTLVEEGQS